MWDVAHVLHLLQHACDEQKVKGGRRVCSVAERIAREEARIEGVWICEGKSKGLHLRIAYCILAY